MVWLAEDPVVLADDLFELITHQGQEIHVGGQDHAVQRELDHRLAAVEGGPDGFGAVGAI